MSSTSRSARPTKQCNVTRATSSSTARMADLSGLDRLWLGLLRTPLSWWARPHVLPDDLRRRYAQHDRPICYVLDVLGVADLIALEQACGKHGLPEPLDGLKPPLPSRSVLFLERRTGFWGDRIDHRI